MHEEIIKLREDAKRNRASFFKMLLRPKLALIVWFRLSNFLKDSPLKPLYYPSKIILHFYRQLTGIQIDTGTQMGGGYILSIIRVLQSPKAQ